MKLRVTPRSSWTSRGLDLVGVFVVILSVEGVVTLLPREQERTSGLQSPSESTRINTTGGRPSGLSNNGSPFHPSAGVETSFSAFGDIDSGRCSFIDNVYVNSGRQYIVFQAMKYDGMNFEDIIRKGHDTMCQDMWEFSLIGVETRKELDNFIYCMLCSFFGFAAQNKTHIITGGIVSVPNGGCSLTEWYKYGSWLDWGTPTTNGIADEVVLLDSTTGEEVPGSNHVHAGKYGVLLLGSMGQKCSSEGNTYRRWGLLKLDATGEALRSIGHGMCETIDSSVSPTTSKTTPTTVPSTTSTTTIASTTSTTTPSTTTTTTTETTTTEATTPTTESTTLSSSTLSSTSSTLATTTPFTVPPDCCLSPSHDGGKITEQDVLCPGLLQETSCPEGFAGVVVIACEGGPPPHVSVVNDTCVHLWVNEVESLIEEGTTPANDIANDVLLHTDAGSSITPDDLERLPTVLHNLTLLEEQQVEAEVDGSSKVALVKDYTETVVKIVDSVLLNTDLWDQVDEELAVFVGPELLKEMEFTSFLLAEVMPFSPAMNYTMKGLTLDVVVYSAPKTDVPDVPLFFPGPRATSYIQLPPGFKNLLGKDPAKKDQREREAGKEKDKEEEGEKEEVGEGEVEGGKEEEKDVEKEEEEEEDGNRGRTFGIRKHEAKWMSDTEYTRDVDENKMYIDNELTKDRVKIDQEKRRGLDQEKKLRTGQAKITPKKRNKLFRNKNKRETEAMNSAAFAKEAKQARQSKGASAKEVKKSKRDEEAFVAQTLTGEGDRAYVSNDPQQSDEQLNNNIENFNNVAVDDERGKDAMLTKQNEEEEHFGTSRSEDKGAENDPKPKGDVKDPLRLVTYILKGPTTRRIMPGSANTLQQGGGRTVNSDVISMTIGAPGMRLEFPRGADGAMIELRHRLHEKGPPYRDIYREPSASSAESAVVGSSRCVFWDYDLRKWNPSGCVVKRRGRDDTRCECRHLTMFAILTDTHHYLGRDKTLDILGTTLSAISCVSLFLAFVALSCTRGGVSSVKSRITRQLCLSLGLSHLFLVLFLDPTVLSLSEDGCLVAAMLIHYLVLSSVTWMLIEGLHLLMVVTCTFASQAHHLPTYWLVGYGSSAVVVATTALVAYGTSPDAWQSQTAYGDLHNGAFCWLSTENGFIWAFTGPLVFVIVFNTVCLIAALRSAAVLQANRQKSLQQKIKVWVKGCFSLNCLLGITWVFGFMYLEENPFFAYVFTVLNASQGVLIFALNCLANDEVRAAVMDKLCQVKRTLTKRSTVLSGSATTAACQQPYHNHHHVHHHARHKRPPHHSATAVARQPFGGSPGGYASRRSDRIQEEHPWRSTLAATPDILQSRCLGSSFDLPSARSRSSAGPLGGRRRREGEGFEPGIRNTAIAGLDSRCQCQAAASTLSVSGSPLSHRKTRNASAWSADTQLSVLSDSSSAEGIGQGNFSRRISSSSSSSFGSSSIDSTSSSYSPGPPPPRPSAPHFHDAFHYATPSLWQVDLRLEGEVEDKSISSFESHRFIPGFESIPEREERRE